MATDRPSVLARIDEFERRRRRLDGTPEEGQLIVPQAPVKEANGNVLPGEWHERYEPPTSTVRKWAFRWSVLALLVASGVAVGFGIVWYLSLAEDEAEKVTDGYRAALIRLDASVNGGESAMLDITSPDTTAEDLVLDLAPFTSFQGAVGTLSIRVRADLPTTPPFAPRDALDELMPLRADLSLVAARADGLIARLGKLITYRLILDEMFALPELPVVATSAEIDTLSASLARALADSVRGFTELPADDFLDEHRATVQEAIDFLREWQPGYISALQSGDQDQAELLALRVKGRIRQVRERLSDPLDAFQRWAGSEFEGLRRDVANGLVLVGPEPSEA